MGNTLGCLALVLAAAAPAAPPKAKPEITYQFQMVGVRGLSWRDPSRTMLNSVAHHGAVSVWTAPGDFLESLPKEALGSITADAKVRSIAQTPAHLTTRKEQAFVTQVSWRGKDRTLRQTTENIRAGVTATVIGRKLDQGVLAQLVIDDADIRSVHTIDVPAPGRVVKADTTGAATCSVTVTASMEVDDGCASDHAAKNLVIASPLENDVDTSGSTSSQTGWLPSKAAIIARAKTDDHAARAGFTGSTSGSQIQLPEIGRASAAGEWLIPEGGVLVVGFGPHTVADADGKAVVREHLAVISAEAEEGVEESTRTPEPPAPVAAPSDHAPGSASVPRTAAATPSLPSRTLPQGVNADGTPAALPPLPDEDPVDEPAPDSISDDPHASPQSKRRPAALEPGPEPAPISVSPLPLSLPRLPLPAPFKAGAKEKKAADHKAAKTSFTFPPLSQLGAGSLFPIPLPGAQFLLPLKAFGIKLPFNQKLEFELLGRIVPDPDASADERVVAAGG